MSISAKKPLVSGLPSAEQDSEEILLERLQNSTNEEDYFHWLLFVVGFYRGVSKADAARALLWQFLETSQSTERKAHCHLALGQIATDEQHLEVALSHFSTALGLDPKTRKVMYVLHNNAGYCFNMLGRYTEGEKHCRIAIEVNWRRASAYRNLGVSFEGQGNIVGAAWALVEAAKLDVSDDRARVLLRKLVGENPKLGIQCPWIVQGLNPTMITGDAAPV